MPTNVLIGSRFEAEMSRMLADDGFWVLRVPQNAGGQQPADLVAVKGRYHALIDCKVLSGDRFPFDRVEDNQYYAMERFRVIGGEVGWFAIRLPDGTIRMLDLETVKNLQRTHKQSLSLKELQDMQYTWSLLDWRERVRDLCK